MRGNPHNLLVAGIHIRLAILQDEYDALAGRPASKRLANALTAARCDLYATATQCAVRQRTLSRWQDNTLKLKQGAERNPAHEQGAERNPAHEQGAERNPAHELVSSNAELNTAGII